MNIIYKYKLEPLTVTRIKLPIGYRILTVGIQRDELCLWVLIDKDQKKVAVDFLVIGTGQLMPEDKTPAADFVGTAVSDYFVWHVFKLV
jgi:hypothetical protein